MPFERRLLRLDVVYGGRGDGGVRVAATQSCARTRDAVTQVKQAHHQQGKRGGETEGREDVDQEPGPQGTVGRGQRTHTVRVGPDVGRIGLRRRHRHRRGRGRGRG